MDIRPGNKSRAMQNARKAIEDAGLNLRTFVIIGETVAGGSSVLYWIVGGSDGGSEAAARSMLELVPPIAVEMIYCEVGESDEPVEDEAGDEE